MKQCGLSKTPGPSIMADLIDFGVWSGANRTGIRNKRCTHREAEHLNCGPSDTSEGAV